MCVFFIFILVNFIQTFHLFDISSTSVFFGGDWGKEWLINYSTQVRIINSVPFDDICTIAFLMNPYTNTNTNTHIYTLCKYI